VKKKAGGYNKPFDEDLKKSLDKFSLEYLESVKDPFVDLFNWTAALQESDYAPLTVLQRKSTVINWLYYNDFGMTVQKERVLNRRLPKKARPTTKDKTLTKGDLQAILQHCRFPLKTVLLCVVSSGMRIGEVMKITYDNVDFESSPVTVTIPVKISKNSVERYTFLSSEAVASLHEWGKIRQQRLERSERRGTGIGRIKYDIKSEKRIFPFIDGTLTNSFVLALKDAGLREKDPESGQGTITFRSCRRYFNSHMKTAMPVGMVELLMGHEGYLARSYDRYEEDEVRKAYLHAEHCVCIADGGDIARVAEELNQARYERQGLESEKERLYAELKKEQDYTHDFENLIKHKDLILNNHQAQIDELQDAIRKLQEKPTKV